MNKYLIFVKHSVPEVVESVPAREWELSEVGRERAQKLAGRLCDYQPGVIVSSVEAKAIQTAEIISEKLNLSVYPAEGLHEHDRNNIPFLSNDAFRKSVQEFFSKPTELVFGNETANQVYERFNQAVYSVQNFHREKTISIVAHGTVISLFVSRLATVHGFSLWSELGLPSFVIVDLPKKLLIKKENIA